MLRLFTKYRDYANVAPDEVSVDLICPLHQPACVQILGYKGPIPDAKKEAATHWNSKRLGRALISTLKIRSYFTNTQRFVTKMEKKSQKKGYHDRTAFATLSLPDAALAVLAQMAAKPPKGCKTIMMLYRLGNKIDNPTPDGHADNCA